MARFPGTAGVRDGASARISSIDSRTYGTLFVTRVPVSAAGPDPADSPGAAMARNITPRNIAVTGAIRRRKGRDARRSRIRLR
jgi:hypothetical protein